MATRRRNRALTIINALLILTMVGSGVYAVAGSTADVNNEISVGAVNIALAQYYEKDGVETEGAYEEEEIIDGDTLSVIPRITNKGISSYIRLLVSYYDEEGNAVDGATVNDLGTDWVQKGNYYYLTREAGAGEVLDVFKSVTVPADWSNGNTKVVMALKADAIQAAHFDPDFTSDTPWGAVAIEDFADSDYQIDSESHSSAVSVSYDGIAEQYVSVPDNFLARLNVLVPGDEVSDEIAVRNNSNEEHEVWVDVEVLDAELNTALTMRILKDGAEIYSGPLASLGELSLGKFAAGSNGAIQIELGLPIDTGNNAGGVASAIKWKFRVDAEEEPVEPETGDKIMAAVVIFLISLGGLIIVSLLEKRSQNEEE